MVGPAWVTPRRAVALLIVLCLAPTVIGGVTAALEGGELASGATNQTVENLTIVTAQGRSPEVVDSPGGIEILNTSSKEQVWEHADPRCMRYYDTEPVDNSTLLITANCESDDGKRVRLAMEYDWRANETDRAFRIPWDAHDVDKLGPHTYAVADIIDQRAYVYNYTADDSMGVQYRGTDVRDSWRQDHVWEYNFTAHFPESAGGTEGYEDDWTHLNDIDAVSNGSAFLLSPRDFNRVMLVNRTTKEVEWTLGEQDDVTILRGQHHPALLTEDPPTVLVGDSLNHRVVEYRYVPEGAANQTAGEWVRTWTFTAEDAGGLNWPRDVHRLPNGNTLVMDTGNDRALEVAPNGTVVWEYETMANPFDIDRYAHGDQPRGPAIHQLRGNTSRANGTVTGSISPLEHFHRLAGFVLPVWVDKWAFLGLLAAGVLAVGWGLTEAGLAVRKRFDIP